MMATNGADEAELIVDDKVIVEAKSTESLRRGSMDQLRSYVHGTRLEVGLFLHFGPEAKFYRVVCENRRKNLPSIPPDPSHS
jgi:GxxExxY protein